MFDEAEFLLRDIKDRTVIHWRSVVNDACVGP